MIRLLDRNLVWLLCACIALGSVLAWRARQFDPFSAHLIEDSLLRYATQGDADTGGLMRAFEKNVHGAAILRVAPDFAGRIALGYTSSFNLQYDLWKPLILVSGTHTRQALALAHLITGTLFAAICGLFLTAIRRDLGTTAMLAASAPFLLAIDMLAAASELYWSLFLVFGPVAILWYAYPALRQRPWAAPAAAFAMFFIAGLRGYEFASAMVIAAGGPVLFTELRQRQRPGAVIARTAAVGIAAALGIIAAMGPHILRAGAYLGSLPRGVAALTLPFRYSTEGDALVPGRNVRGAAAFHAALEDYLSRDYVLFLSLRQLVIGGVILITAMLCLRRFRLAPDEAGLLAATALGMVAALSWWLAYQHVLIHRQIDWLPYSLFFLPLLLATVAILLRRSFKPAIS